MRELNRISITARCSQHFDKVIYRSRKEAVTYGALNRIRYSGKQQTPYRCPWRNHWHLHTNWSAKERRRNRRDRFLVEAWENEGGACI